MEAGLACLARQPSKWDEFPLVFILENFVILTLF